MKKNGKHETSPAGLRAAKRDNKIAAVYAGLHRKPWRLTEDQRDELRNTHGFAGDVEEMADLIADMLQKNYGA